MLLQQIISILFVLLTSNASVSVNRAKARLFSSARKQSWERKSFEDESYDATTEEVDYKDWDEGKWSKANRPKFCFGAEKQQICKCESNGGRSDLSCESQNLATTDAELPQNFNPSVVHMEHNKIKYLIKDKILPGKESNVLSLDFSSNLISDIQPGTFNQFTKLQVLMLTHNKLDSEQISVDVFTPGLGESLHQLYLDYNFITTLDEGVFDNLSQLRKLVLDGNREIQLSRGVFTNAAFDVLEVLSLDKCGIKELDEHIFANLTSLRALSLSGNPLDRIPLALSPLHSLTHLAMSSTNLKELKEGPFQTIVPGLEKLYMRKMKYLWKIGTNAFKGLKKLKFLDFAYSTKLRLFEPNVFGLDPPRNFSELNLQQCNLSTLSAEVMSPIYWKSMDVIKLDGNPFVCDCKLKWLLDMKNVMRTVYRTDEPTCKYPSELKGLSLYDANKLNDLCDPTPSSTGKFVVFLVCMVLSASLVAVGLVYARRRYEAKYGGDVHLPRFVGGSSAFPRAHQMGIFEDGEEENEIEEQQPQEGGERPEFV